MADQTLRDVATDGETQGLFGGDGDEERFPAGSSWWCLLLESSRVLYTTTREGWGWGVKTHRLK